MSDDTLDMFPDELPKKPCIVDVSAACIAQRFRLLQALRLGPVSTIDARERLNIMHPAQRIQELEQLGYKFKNYPRRAIDFKGDAHRGIAHYVLIASPESSIDDVPELNPDDFPELNPDDFAELNPDDFPELNPDDFAEFNLDDMTETPPQSVACPTGSGERGNNDGE